MSLFQKSEPVHTLLLENNEAKSPGADNALKVGAAEEPLAGPENTVLVVCVASDPVNVPLVVTGLPETVMKLGRLNPTLVTVPDPAADQAIVPSVWPVTT